MQVLSLGVLLLVVLGSCAEGQRLLRRRTSTTSTTTSTTTTEPPATEPDGPSITERETNLLQREQNLNAREKKFREREVTLTLREEQIRFREQKVADREDKIRQQELKVSELVPQTTPPPDYSLVRQDVVSGRLIEIGSTELCPANMRFFAIPGNKTAGACDCDYHQCARPLLYSKKHDQCFWAWSQGPCEQGEWFTYNDTLHPTCAKTKCPLTSLAVRTNMYYFEDPDDGECYETTTRGYCQGDGETLLPTSDDPFPKCRTHTLCFPLSTPAQQECIAGNKRHLTGLCE